MFDGKIAIRSLLPEELEAELKAMGEPAYRAKQVFSWLSRGVSGFGEMTDLPKALRERLDGRFYLAAPQVLRKQVSAHDGTVKYLWGLSDGNAVETVVMQYHHGNTVCISTQVGCRQGCAFCASTIGGLVRSLEPGEMLEEVMFSEKDSGLKISNIVLMGIGEPLDNFDNVVKFLQLVNCPQGMDIGMRHISLSTCGLTERFDKLAALNLQLTLSVSLHAPDDETRSRIMPANRGRGVAQLMDACERYYRQTGRRISFEYAMIDGVNDSDAQAALLAAHAKRVSAHVNLIPLNHVEESKLRPPPPGRLGRPRALRGGGGETAPAGRSRGGDIDAPCGQLRKKAAAGRA